MTTPGRLVLGASNRALRTPRSGASATLARKHRYGNHSTDDGAHKHRGQGICSSGPNQAGFGLSGTSRSPPDVLAPSGGVGVVCLILMISGPVSPTSGFRLVGPGGIAQHGTTSAALTSDSYRAHSVLCYAGPCPRELLRSVQQCLMRQRCATPDRGDTA
jgi:hypothetical protein